MVGLQVVVGLGAGVAVAGMIGRNLASTWALNERVPNVSKVRKEYVT